MAESVAPLNADAVPAPQFWQLEDPVVDWNWPAAHNAHTRATSVAEYNPVAQGAQLVAPVAADAVPRKQPLQKAAPDSAMYVPAGHEAHTMALAAEKNPAGHPMQRMAPEDAA